MKPPLRIIMDFKIISSIFVLELISSDFILNDKNWRRRMKYFFLIAMMIVPIIGQFNGCDYHQKLDVNKSYNVFSPNFPYSYNSKTYCRWTAEAPMGYSVILNCTEIYLPPVRIILNFDYYLK